MYDFEQKLRKLLSKIKYEKEITNAIIEYGRALDNRNWRTAFLRLWIVLEELTHTCSDGYKVTIRRASFVFKEREYHRQILNHLRDLRNSFVMHTERQTISKHTCINLKDMLKHFYFFI